MSFISDNSRSMENIVRSASSPPPNESMINSEEIPELPSFHLISQPSNNSSQLEEAFVPTGSPAYMAPEFLESKPLSPLWYGGAAYNLRFGKKIGIPVRRAPDVLPDVMSIAQIIKNILNLSTGGAPRKKLTPVEEEVEIRKSIVGASRTIMKGKTLSVSQLDDIWSRINMLEEDMQESQDKLLSSCSKYRETIGSLKAEFRSLLIFVAPNLRGTCQLHALMREVDRGSDLEWAQISTSSISDTKNPTGEFLIGDAAIHSLHGNTAKTSIASFGIGNTTQTMDSVNVAGLLMLSSRGRGEERWLPLGRVFECKTCNRQFQSFQALGGHRAIHKKGHWAIPKKPMLEVHDYTDLEWARSTPFSFGQASSNGGISAWGDQSHPTLGGNRMSEQDAAKLKSFDKFSQWATALLFAILIGLLAVNAKQAQFLFRSCSTLVFGATISGIAMLLLVLMGHSSRRILTSLKMLQYLIIGLLFITAIQVYMFTLK